MCLARALFLVGDFEIVSAPSAVPWEFTARAPGKGEQDKSRADNLSHCRKSPLLSPPNVDTTEHLGRIFGTAEQLRSGHCLFAGTSDRHLREFMEQVPVASRGSPSPVHRCACLDDRSGRPWEVPQNFRAEQELGWSDRGCRPTPPVHLEQRTLGVHNRPVPITRVVGQTSGSAGASAAPKRATGQDRMLPQSLPRHYSPFEKKGRNDAVSHQPYSH